MKVWAGTGLAAGVLIVVSAFAHAAGGWAQFEPSLTSAGLNAEVIEGLHIGWLWGSIAMLCMGIIVTREAWAGLRGGMVHRAPIAAIAVAYTVFGLWAFFSRGMNPHFMVFVVTGLLVSSLLRVRRPKEHDSQRS